MYNIFCLIISESNINIILARRKLDDPQNKISKLRNRNSKASMKNQPGFRRTIWESPKNTRQNIIHSTRPLRTGKMKVNMNSVGLMDNRFTQLKYTSNKLARDEPAAI
jgi:hypothetical protein